VKSSIRPWPIRRSEQLLETPVFRIRAQTCASPQTGVEHAFMVMDTRDWVNVIPLTDEGEVVMVQQYRQGVGRVTLETPGGVIDAADGGPEESARRELCEETGYLARRLERLATLTPNPAIQTNVCHVFLASDLELVGPPHLDCTEDIEVVRVPLGEVAAMIRSGEIDHAIVVAAFWHLRERGLFSANPVR